MDFKAITPGTAEQSVDSSLHWLANQQNGNWLLLFNNADDVHLKLKKFFPPSASGNILVTTRNRELCHYAAKGWDEKVTGMDHEDAKTLLLHLSQVEETDENKVLAAQIVQVFFHFFGLRNDVKLGSGTGTPSFCLGSLPSQCFHSLPLLIKGLSGTLSM